VLPLKLTDIPPRPSLDCLPVESHRVKELVLSRDHLVEVFVRIEIERGLNARMTQDALHSFRVLLRLVHQPVRQPVSKVVQTPTVSRWDDDPAFFAAGRKCLDENEGVEGDGPTEFKRLVQESESTAIDRP